MKPKRRVSLGTISMLLLTAAVLAAYCMLLPTLTGSQDIRLDATKLVVAIDESISQITASAEDLLQRSAQQKEPLSTASLPAQILATPAPAPVTPPPKLQFSLCASGSIQLNQTVQKALTIDNVYRFDLLTDHLNMQADLSIATLENTIVSSQKLSHLNMPVQLLPALQSAGINALSIGHANALNYGVTGLQETYQAVQKAGMVPYGLYLSENDRKTATQIHTNGITVAMLAYQNDISSTGNKQITAEERAFVYTAITPDEISADIQTAKADGADVIVVSLRWGKAGASSPTDEQRTLAQQIANAGADIILGTQTGALQPVQVLSADRGDGRYHPVLCAYSLGNLMTHDREKRASLASILLKADVIFDTATGCVSFNNLCYSPTYAWRGKDDGRTLYRILVNDGVHYPDFVDQDQKGVMQRCFTLVNDVMSDTGIPMSQ